MNKIQNLIDLIAAEEAQQAKLKKLIAQSESNVRVHNAALDRLRFPRQQISSGAAEIKPITQLQPKEEWLLIGREDIGELIKAGDTVNVVGDCDYDGIYNVDDTDSDDDEQPLCMSGNGNVLKWILLDDDAEIYLKMER